MLEGQSKTIEIGWVASEVAKRWRQHYGTYHAFEWMDFLRVIDLRFEYAPLPRSLPAMLVDDTILVRPDLSRAVTAVLVWHEVGHHAMHAGGAGFWHARPMGQRSIAKWERQAWEFVAFFPHWDEHAKREIAQVA